LVGRVIEPAGGSRNNTQLPYYLQHHVSLHHNSITQNASYGDELFSATPAGAGGATFCTGSDYYKFNYNWVCGNLSTGDGGGVGHIGFNWNGTISHNTIIFNQSNNPTIPAHGGGLLIGGASPDGFVNGVECGTTVDIDCTPGLADGAGPNLVVDSNLILGNTLPGVAELGHPRKTFSLLETKVQGISRPTPGWRCYR
jgi:hypothetical protein